MYANPMLLQGGLHVVSGHDAWTAGLRHPAGGSRWIGYGMVCKAIVITEQALRKLQVELLVLRSRICLWVGYRSRVEDRRNFQ